MGRTWSPGFVFLWSPRTTARKGLVHLVITCQVVLVLCWLGVHLGGETGSPPPSPSATSSCTVASSEEEAHILGVYFFIDAAYHGGGRIGTSPFLLTMSRSSPEEEGQALLLILPVCTSEGEGQAFSLTTTATTSEEEEEGQALLLTMSVSSLRGAVLARLGRFGDTIRLGRNGAAAQMGRSGDTIRLGRNGAAAQMGRSGDTMVCGLATTCTLLQVGTARDAFRYHAMVCVADHGLYRTELSTVGSLRRYFPFSMRTRRLGCTLAGSVRCSVVGVRTTVGLNRLGLVRVQTWMFGVYLAHIKCVSRRRVITQRAATHPCRENHGVVYLQGEELLAVR